MVSLTRASAVFVFLSAIGCSSSSDDEPNPAAGGGGSGNASGAGGSSSGGSANGGGGPKPIEPSVEPGSCGLDQPAFCEKFETPKPGGRGGDLDEARWSFSRWGHEWEHLWVRVPASTYPDHLFPATFCGAPFSNIGPGEDVRICDGVGVDGTTSHQLNEVFDDQEDFGFNSMRIRQPFDFTDRTGKVVWDVDAKINPLNVGHGWWIEVWITEDPSPMPYHEAPTVTSFPRNGLGLALRFGGACEQELDGPWQSALETVHVTKDHQLVHAYDYWSFASAYETRCFRTFDGKLNHFELRVSKDALELWVADYDDPASLALRARVEDLDLPFTRGYVHLQHAHYNAQKDGLEGCGSGGGDLTQCPTRSQTFRWDNIGFDGPTYPLPRAYDVPDNDEPRGSGTMLGYDLGPNARAFTLDDVDVSGGLRAWLAFDVMQPAGATFEYRFNGNPWHSFVLPETAGVTPDASIHGYALEAPLAELVSGTNVIEVRSPEPGPWVPEGIGNIDLTIEVQ
jgi:hypothetical protein